MVEEKKDLFDFSDRDKRTKSFFKFEDNKEICGILLNIEDGQYGDTYLLETPNHMKIYISGYTALKDKILRSDIGKPIKIVYLGEERSKLTKMVYKNFEVYIKEV